MIGRLLQWSSEALKSKTLHNWAERFSVNVETLEPVLCSLSSGALLETLKSRCGGFILLKLAIHRQATQKQKAQSVDWAFCFI
ncbi:hypothetical protein, partial [Cronobacter sakazakii]|uniref:hypothetical protein n=1 Tax=Cronobacter sakazakii TaxID=28141 RepID=UPI001C4D2CD3